MNDSKENYLPTKKNLQTWNAKVNCWASSVIINGICSKLCYGATVPIMSLSESLTALSSQLHVAL